MKLKTVLAVPLLIAHASAVIVNVLGLPMIQNKTKEMESLKKLFAEYKTETNGEIDIRYQFAETMVTTEYAALVTDMLRDEDKSVDIFMIDVVWPGAFASKLLDLTQHGTLESIVNGHNPAIAMNNYIDGKLDLLKKYGYTKAPRTWDDVEEMSLKIIQGEATAGSGVNLVGYVGQFNAYEGLTCNVMEWLWSSDCGSIIDSEKNVTVASGCTSQILNRIKGFFQKGITPSYAQLYDESASLNKWLAGETIFMRNWPYAMGETKTNPNVPFNGTLGVDYDVTKIPGVSGEKTAATLGGWAMAATSYSRNPEAAAKAIQFLSSAKFQKQRAIDVGLLPTRTSLYEDPEVCAAIGNCALWASLNVIPRPSTPSGSKYLEISKIIYDGFNLMIRGQKDIEKYLKTIKADIEKQLGTYVEPPIDYGPPVYLSFSSPETIAVIAITLLLLVFGLYTTLRVIMERKKKAVVSASPKFCVLMLFGCMLALIGIIVSSGPPSDIKCQLFAWLSAISVGIIMGSLLVKTVRIYLIFNNPILMRAIPMKDNHLFMAVGVMVCIEMTRNVGERFNESTHIGLCMYTFAVSFLILIAVPFLGETSVSVPYIVRSVAINFSVAAVIGILIFSKLLKADDDEKEDVLAGGGSAAASKGRSGIGSQIKTVKKTVASSVSNNGSEAKPVGDMISFGGLHKNCSGSFWAATTPWKRATFYFHTVTGLLALSSEAGSNKVGGACVNLRSMKIEDAVLEQLGDTISQITCTIGGRHWEFQTENASQANLFFGYLKDMCGK
ncbi:hypothetical protein HDV02_001157 [Globomyces sp. JEL0801]|nr:hypothetical protein HDV02_001157 [Globomyces sp. JEL0801]